MIDLTILYFHGINISLGIIYYPGLVRKKTPLPQQGRNHVRSTVRGSQYCSDIKLFFNNVKFGINRGWMVDIAYFRSLIVICK